MTAEELFDLPDDGYRHELIEGVLQTTAPTGWEHGLVTGAAVQVLRTHVRAQRLGHVLTGEPGFLLRQDPDTVRAPDVAFLRAEVVAALADDTGFVEVVPDLVVEVVSPSDRAGEVTAKALVWLDAGVRLVWVVDPGSRSIMVHRPDGVGRLVRGPGAVLDGDDVLPGLGLPLDQLFG